ncbi:hypothetical protein BGZ65_006466 [Modicella reniformis]|uniref:Uncharacterized protein n=1 Tax=Modicella reniformis TaxID=1440133 RepID=A0A9P6IJD6_9FUNG|nr:hypothetical protein BGZ65_006466 [Modicella reniformis]
MEDNLAKFTMTAQAFATNDGVLVNRAKIGLTQRKTELYQREKDGLAAELKQFGKDLTVNATTAGSTTTTIEKKETKEKENENRNEKEKDKDKKEERIIVETTTTTTTTSKPAKETATATATGAASSTAAGGEKPISSSSSSSSFKLNVKAPVFKPNVNAPFTPSFASGGGDKKVGTVAGSTTTTTTMTMATLGSGVTNKNLFFERVIKRGPLPLRESMSSPFKQGQTMPNPTNIGPIWPYGVRPFRHLFQVARYDEDMIYSNPGMVVGGGQHGVGGGGGNGGAGGGGGGGGYYAMGAASPYNFGPSAGQFSVPPMTMATGPNHIGVPYLGTSGPIPPYSQPPPPPPGMPHSGTVGPAYAQLAPTSTCAL